MPLSPQEVYDLFSRHVVTEYDGDTNRDRAKRWKIACSCGFTARAPEYAGVETAFGAHVIGDPVRAAPQ